MTISINDGKSTPVAHVFSQDREQQGATPALFVNRAGTDGPMSWETIESHAKLAAKKTDEHVTRHVIRIPKVGTKDGAPYVVGWRKLFITAASEQSVSGEDDLADLYALGANWLAATAVKTAGKKLQPLTG